MSRLDPFLQPRNLAVPGHGVIDALAVRPDCNFLPDPQLLADLVLGLPGCGAASPIRRSQVEWAERLVQQVAEDTGLPPGAILAGAPGPLPANVVLRAMRLRFGDRLPRVGVAAVAAADPLGLPGVGEPVPARPGVHPSCAPWLGIAR